MKASKMLMMVFVWLTAITTTNAQVIVDSLYGNNAGSKFGYSVDIAQKGSWVVIGVPESNNVGDLVNTTTNRGAAYAYTLGNEGYELKGQILGGNDANDYFGYSVAISNEGDFVVGSRFDSDDHSAGGNVRVFNFNDGTGRWDETADLPSRQDNEQWGWDVSITRDGEFLAGSAVTHSYTEGPNSAGVVRVYRKNNDSWASCSSITYPGSNGSAEFGTAIAITKGDVNGVPSVLVAVSASKDNPNDVEFAGSVWVYKTNADCSVPWALMGESLIGTHFDDNFGSSLDLSTSTQGIFLAVGAVKHENENDVEDAGMAQVFEFVNDAWVQKGSTLYGEQAQQYLGASINIVGDRLAIGSSQFDIGNGYINQGKVDVYQFYGDWKPAIAPLQEDQANSFLGSSLAFDGTHLIAGAPRNSDIGNQFGKVIIASMANEIGIDSVEATLFADSIFVHFSEGVFGDGDRSLGAALENFVFTFDFFSNDQLSAEVTAVTNVNGEALAGGEQVLKFSVNYTNGMPTSGDRIIITLAEGETLFDSYGLPVREDLEARYLYDYVMGMTKVVEPDNGDIFDISIPTIAQLGENANAYRLYYGLKNPDTGAIEAVYDTLLAANNLSTVSNNLPKGDIQIRAQSVYIINTGNQECIIPEGDINVIVKEASCNLVNGGFSVPVEVTLLRHDIMGVAQILNPTPDTIYVGNALVYLEPGEGANAHRIMIAKGSFEDENHTVVVDSIIVLPKEGMVAHNLETGAYSVKVQSLYITNLNNPECADTTNDPFIKNRHACEWYEGPTTEMTNFEVLEPIVSPLVSGPSNDTYEVDSLHFVIEEVPDANFHHIRIVSRDSVPTVEQYRYMDRYLAYTGATLDTTIYFGWQGTFDVYVRSVNVLNLESMACENQLNVGRDYYYERGLCQQVVSEWTGPISMDAYITPTGRRPLITVDAEISTERVPILFRSHATYFGGYEFTNANRIQVAVDSFDVENPVIAIDTVVFSQIDTLYFDLEVGMYEVKVQGLTIMNRDNAECVITEEGSMVSLVNLAACEYLETPYELSRFIRAEPISSELDSQLPMQFDLSQNYPNPFNPSTSIQFSLPEATHVRLDVFNSLGQLVYTLVNEQRSTGIHTVRFNAAGLSSGVYLYKITTADFSQTKKMLLVK